MQPAPLSRPSVGTVDLEAHYARLLASHASSGVSLRRFAAQQGVSVWTLYAWRRRLAKKSAAAPLAEPALVAVDVIGAQPRSPTATYELALPGGACLHLPRDFDAQRVAELLLALRSC